MFCRQIQRKNLQTANCSEPNYGIIALIRYVIGCAGYYDGHDVIHLEVYLEMLSCEGTNKKIKLYIFIIYTCRLKKTRHNV